MDSTDLYEIGIRITQALRQFAPAKGLPPANSQEQHTAIVRLRAAIERIPDDPSIRGNNRADWVRRLEEWGAPYKVDQSGGTTEVSAENLVVELETLKDQIDRFAAALHVRRQGWYRLGCEIANGDDPGAAKYWRARKAKDTIVSPVRKLRRHKRLGLIFEIADAKPRRLPRMPPPQWVYRHKDMVHRLVAELGVDPGMLLCFPKEVERSEHWGWDAIEVGLSRLRLQPPAEPEIPMFMQTGSPDYANVPKFTVAKIRRMGGGSPGESTIRQAFKDLGIHADQQKYTPQQVEQLCTHFSDKNGVRESTIKGVEKIREELRQVESQQRPGN